MLIYVRVGSVSVRLPKCSVNREFCFGFFGFDLEFVVRSDVEKSCFCINLYRCIDEDIEELDFLEEDV